MAQWYFHIPGQADRIGPLDDASARAHAQRQPDALAWRDGLDGWTPARQLAELQGAGSLPPQLSGTGAARADEIDYRIVGNDMQFVEVELDPGESAIAEAGALMYKDAAVQMDTVFGDGSHDGQGGSSGGLMGKLLSAGKRVVTGESMFTTVFTHAGSGKAKVAFAAPYPGTVLALRLSEHGGRLICQKDSFLAGARGVSLGIAFQRKILTGLFGGEDSSCRSSKATAGCSCMPAAPWWNATWRRANASTWTPAAWSPTTPAWTWTCAASPA